VTAAARSLGHYLALAITGSLMLLVGGMLLRASISGQRRYMEGPRRYAPFAVFCIAYPLILADPLRHVLGDVGIWAGCGNNPTFSRINASDPYPDTCWWSSYQFHCTVQCCVPTWLPVPDSNYSRYAFYPRQSVFFPAPNAIPGSQFATLRPDGTIFFPPAFDHSQQPFEVYNGSDPILFYETGKLNPQRGSATQADCPFGVNKDTGYCFLTNTSLPYEEQLRQLPRPKPNLPYDNSTNAGSCDCNQCTPTETMTHSSPMGVLFTIFFTYTGFLLLAIAVMWNANIIAKLKKIRKQWNELRPAARF